MQDAGADGGAAREKRKFEGVAQASFGVKNAVLGLVFGVSTARSDPARPARPAGTRTDGPVCYRKSTR